MSSVNVRFPPVADIQRSQLDEAMKLVVGDDTFDARWASGPAFDELRLEIHDIAGGASVRR
jgi:hypothetical protein